MSKRFENIISAAIALVIVGIIVACGSGIPGTNDQAFQLRSDVAYKLTVASLTAYPGEAVQIEVYMYAPDADLAFATDTVRVTPSDSGIGGPWEFPHVGYGQGDGQEVINTFVDPNEQFEGVRTINFRVQLLDSEGEDVNDRPDELTDYSGSSDLIEIISHCSFGSDHPIELSGARTHYVENNPYTLMVTDGLDPFFADYLEVRFLDVQGQILSTTEIQIDQLSSDVAVTAELQEGVAIARGVWIDANGNVINCGEFDEIEIRTLPGSGPVEPIEDPIEAGLEIPADPNSPPDNSNSDPNEQTPPLNFAAKLVLDEPEFRTNQVVPAKLVLAEPADEVQDWVTTSNGVIADKAVFSVPIGANACDFKLESLGNVTLGASAWIWFYTVTYGVFVHPDAPEIIGHSFVGTVDGDQGTKASVLLRFQRIEYVSPDGRNWTSTIRIDVSVDADSGDSEAWFEMPIAPLVGGDYPFRESGLFRVFVDRLSGRDLTITMEYHLGGGVTEKFTGAIRQVE